MNASIPSTPKSSKPRSARLSIPQRVNTSTPNSPSSSVGSSCGGKKGRRAPTSSPSANHTVSAPASPVVVASATPSGRKNNTKSANSNNAQRKSPKLSFLEFQPALQSCFVTPVAPPNANTRRSSPRTAPAAAPTTTAASIKFSSVQNGFNNSLSPVKLASPAIAPILRQSQSNTQRRLGKNSDLFKQTPFAGAKYLDLPCNAELPSPPSWLLNDKGAESPVVEPPSPTTAQAVQLAQQQGFDGRIRIHPLQLIAAVSSA